MPTTTQNQNARNTAAIQQETVLAHAPLMRDNKAQQECWANFGVAFHTRQGLAYLQPGQFIPIWELRAGLWQYSTPVQISVVSAFVVGGRYMIRGGDAKLSSHPKIEEWNCASPVKGMASELRHPSGVRRITPSNHPVIAVNARNYESRAVSASAFHSKYGASELFSGCPLTLACCADASTATLFRASMTPMFDIVRRQTVTGHRLPIPFITSNEEEVVLKDYPHDWMKAVYEMLDLCGIVEVGLLYDPPNDQVVVDEFSGDRPTAVYRNALNKGDLGFSTLDPDLYERMLPFATGRFDSTMMPLN
jgi:hypothetical protein